MDLHFFGHERSKSVGLDVFIDKLLATLHGDLECIQARPLDGIDASAGVLAIQADSQCVIRNKH
eukprot:693923-Amphidinium_carterae.3